MHRNACILVSTLLLVPTSAIAELRPVPNAEATDAPAIGVEQEESEQEDQKEAFEAALSFESGDVTVGDDLATFHLGESLRFLGKDDAARLLSAWGNPPGEAPLGIVMSKDASVFDEASWAVVVSYVDDGHVEDEDAKDIDFDELLNEMKEETEELNPEREKAGYPPVHIVGWAEPPHYDASSRKLYWAKELDFGSSDHTLNYSIRVLGRTGVLELNAIATMGQLATVKAAMPGVLNAVEFNPGKRYSDFTPSVDKVAAYGIGALIAGKVAAKAGLFKVIIALLFASKKLLVAGGVGVFVLLKKLLSRKKEEPTTP